MKIAIMQHLNTINIPVILGALGMIKMNTDEHIKEFRHYLRQERFFWARENSLQTQRTSLNMLNNVLRN